MAAGLLHWLSSQGDAAPYLIFALVFAESGLMLFIPGETAVLLGGVLASQDAFSVARVGLAAVLGAVLGDSTGYLLGRGPGRRRYERRHRFGFLRERHVQRMEVLLERWGGPAVFLARFVPLGRVAGPFAFGLTGVRPRGFFPFVFVSGLLWGAGFTALGYVLGDAWEEVHRWFGRVALALLLAISLAAFVVLALRRWRSKPRGP
jgi:membrane protein DedA with SNARE-associated domain